MVISFSGQQNSAFLFISLHKFLWKWLIDIDHNSGRERRTGWCFSTHRRKVGKKLMMPQTILWYSFTADVIVNDCMHISGTRDHPTTLHQPPEGRLPLLSDGLLKVTNVTLASLKTGMMSFSVKFGGMLHCPCHC